MALYGTNVPPFQDPEITIHQIGYPIMTKKIGDRIDIQWVIHTNISP